MSAVIHLIEQKLAQSHVKLCRLGSTTIVLDSRGVIFLPKHKLLVFSDLHFEKASYLSKFANPLPQIDTRVTLENMKMMIDTYQPESVVCLGDSFHDLDAVERMAHADLSFINQLVGMVKEWFWILGNHDPKVDDEVLGNSTQYYVVDDILLVHEPEDIGQFPSCNAQIIGHFHPKGKVKLGSRKLTGKLFLLDQEHLFMPAFGAYTGGLDYTHPVFMDYLDAKHVRYILVGDNIYQV